MSIRVNLPGMPDYNETKKAVEEYEPVQVLGTQKVAGKEFTAIEGGFGEGRKAMLAKDIAEIHGKEVKAINRLINSNLTRFKVNVDVIDLKNCGASEAPQFETMGFTKMQVSKADNVYLLSERGYAKLLKIMEDDLAWELYDELVDGYFNMRAEKKEQTGYGELSPQLQLLINMEMKQKELEQKIINQEAKVESIKDVVSLNLTNWRKDTSNLINKIAMSLGGYEHIRHVRDESYRLLEGRAGCKLSIRLTNKRQRMADEGVSKSKRDKLSKLDVIADDKKLIEIYVAIIKDMSIKNGVAD